VVHGENAAERVSSSAPREARAVAPVSPGFDAGCPGRAEGGNEVGEGPTHGGDGGPSTGSTGLAGWAARASCEFTPRIWPSM
jgi:hypothetical protein